MTKYESLLVGPLARRVFNAHLAGFAYGYSLCIRFVYVGIVFFIGSRRRKHITRLRFVCAILSNHGLILLYRVGVFCLSCSL